MDVAAVPETNFERARRSLNSVTRGWFLGYSWKQTRYYADGQHLQLVPDGHVQGLEEMRLGCLIDAFRDAGTGMSGSTMRVDRIMLRNIGSTVEIVHPNGEFLDEHTDDIRKKFEDKLRLRAGRVVHEMSPGC